MSSFGTWNGVEPWPIFDGVGIHAIGGDQVLLCRARYEPGTTVKRHSHEDTEQVMLILDGSLDMTIGDESKHLVAGDVASSTAGSSTSCTPPTASRSWRRCRPSRSTTCRIASATWSSASLPDRCTSSGSPQLAASRRVTRPTARITNTSTTFRPTTQRRTAVKDPVLSRTAPSANGASAAIV